MDINNQDFWEDKYQNNATGWDLGNVSPPLKAYFDQLKNKNIRILIPGAGNAYEAEYLHHQGFTNVYVADWAQTALNNIQERIPSFPKEHLLLADFFTLQDSFDLIIEQTFFCAITPNLREKYIEKMHELLQNQGKLVGLLFQIPLNTSHPPFGGSKEEYLSLFEEKFDIHVMETAYNSISPRANNELFVLMQVKPHN
jgi:methyl halide transferase